MTENIALAHGHARGGRLIGGTATESVTDSVLRLVGADFPATARISSLWRAQKSPIAIAHALAALCDYLVLDEPIASLPADAVVRLFSALCTLKLFGVGMFYVGRRVEEYIQIAVGFAVLRDGQMVGVRLIEHTTPEEILSPTVSHKAREINRSPMQEGPEILRLESLATPAVGPVRLEIKRGERLDLAGLRGAGHEDIGCALFGVMPHPGRVSRVGQLPDLNTTQFAMRSCIGFVARNRVGESVAAGLTIRKNAFL
ncbi:MAG: hypothetical protein ACOH2H_22690 [Cypionkella sp.]